MPKGILHHLHLGACFNNIYEAIKSTLIDLSARASIVNSAFLLLTVFEEDNIIKGKLSDVTSAKVYLIENIKEMLLVNSPEKEKLFKESYLTQKGTCKAASFKTNFDLLNQENLKMFYYWRFSKTTQIFTELKEELVKYSVEKKIYKNERNAKNFVMNLSAMSTRLNWIGVVSEKFGAYGSLPQSALDLTTSRQELESNAVWARFEGIFGMCENLFAHPVLMNELIKYLTREFQSQKIYGVEFRQKFDKQSGEAKSKYLALKTELGKGNILTSFILPGRKVLNGNSLLLITEKIRSNEEADVVGIDFVGFEDDAFSGARNFLSSTIINEMGVDSENNTVNLFETLFETLKNSSINDNNNNKKFYPHAGETLFFPDYPVGEEFLNEFYINDNLLHAALLPNVARVGDGFAVIKNGLLATIMKKKKIGIELCPISNQLLKYYKVYENPGLDLLRMGLKVAISPDDPGFFNYMGVSMDWFYLIMATDIKPSEIYMLLKNSILKAAPNIAAQKGSLVARLQDDLDKFFNGLKCEISEQERKSLVLTKDEINQRISAFRNHRTASLKEIEKTQNKRLKNYGKFLLKSIYDEKDLINYFSQKFGHDNKKNKINRVD